MWRFIVPLENEGEPEFWKGESKKINFLLYNYMKVHKFSTLLALNVIVRGIKCLDKV